MKKIIVALGIVSLSLFGAGCDKEDMDAASEKLKEAGSKVGDAIEETGSKLGEDMEAGKQKMRDEAEKIEKD